MVTRVFFDELFEFALFSGFSKCSHSASQHKWTLVEISGIVRPMSSGYRTIAILCLGISVLIALGAGAFFGSLYAPDKSHYRTIPADGSQTYPRNAPKNGLADISGIDGPAERIIAQPQPRNTKERQDRVLAAQEAVAVFGYWGFWGIVLQTVLAGGALIALLADLKQNRRSSEAQLRAYITVEPGGINAAEDGMYRIPYKIANQGQTPAYNISIFGDILIMGGGDPRVFDPEEDGRLGEAEAFSDITIGPQSNIWNFAYQPEDLFAPYLTEIDQKESAIIHYGFIEYKDAFGHTRRTSYAFYHWGEELSDVESKRCRFGNNAT